MKTGSFGKKKNIRVLALFLAVALIFLETATKNVYAGKADHQYGDAYGAKNDDEEFYMWSRVSDTKQPLYASLNDYNEHKSEYESGDRTFRVMLVQHIDRGSGCKKIAGVEGESLSIFSSSYSYDMFVYYQADWTRFDYGEVYHSGDSLVAVANNPQVDVRSDGGGQNGLLFTRGSQRTFICKNAKDKKNNYYFYYPDESDRNPLYMLCFGQTFWTSNLYLFDEAGNSWGKNSSKSRSEVNGGVGGYTRDTWEVSQGKNGAMYINTDNGLRLGIWDAYGLGVDKWVFSDNDSWYIYVGAPCDPDTLDSIIKSDNSMTLGDGARLNIEKPTYIKKNETLVINDGAVLFVDNLLILNGKIENHGTIVVNPSGAICQWDKGLGVIDCSGSGPNNNGGDILIRDHGKIFVNEFKGNLGHLVLQGELAANKFEINNCVIDYFGKKDRLKGASSIKDFRHVMRAVDNETKKYVVGYIGSDIRKNGSGEKKTLNNNIEH